MELNEEIARILLDPENNRILKITFYQKNLKFQCQQRAAFCCKLGGPKLTRRDVQRIEEAGHHRKEFSYLSESDSKDSPIFLGNLRSKEDGSCIFLESNPEGRCYECSIYDFRPALCKLYPFDFCKVDFQSLVLRIIPCCNGLGTQDGTSIDERFVADLLRVACEII